MLHSPCPIATSGTEDDPTDQSVFPCALLAFNTSAARKLHMFPAIQNDGRMSIVVTQRRAVGTFIATISHVAHSAAECIPGALIVGPRILESATAYQYFSAKISWEKTEMAILDCRLAFHVGLHVVKVGLPPSFQAPLRPRVLAHVSLCLYLFIILLRKNI